MAVTSYEVTESRTSVCSLYPINKIICIKTIDNTWLINLNEGFNLNCSTISVHTWDTLNTWKVVRAMTGRILGKTLFEFKTNFRHKVPLQDTATKLAYNAGLSLADFELVKIP